MRKIIELHQENLIVCDNPACDYKIPNPTGEDIDTIEYLNNPCPQCGENLLTENDYNVHRSIMKYINNINKYFSWITIFFPKKKYKQEYLKVHNGVHITDQKPVE